MYPTAMIGGAIGAMLGWHFLGSASTWLTRVAPALARAFGRPPQ
jgi:hypothetical protein